MSRLHYWHPVFASRKLTTRRPAGIRLDGRDLALFRTCDGKLGAIDDKCAHRRMKLSRGRIEGERVICPYHGWSFNTAGEGESPSAPKLHACVASYDCAESAGAIWVKARGSEQPLPSFAKEGWDFAGAVFNELRAPLQLVIDNFSEIEHTVTTHPHFGFDPKRAHEAVIKLEADDDSVTVRGHGPAKRPPLDTCWSVAFRRGDRFHADYTFRFDPPRSTVTHWWSDPQTGSERKFKYHIVHYFVAQDEAVTLLVTFCFLKTGRRLLRMLKPMTARLFRSRTWETVEEDAVLLSHLADQSTSLEGMKLSRFDPVLALTRERLARIYGGGPPAPIALPAAVCAPRESASTAATSSARETSFPASGPFPRTRQTQRLIPDSRSGGGSGGS
ncbi:MAG: Rieske 2Fe-2S domain-containing protein [Chthoniobacterales bacterium]